jgi:hypothetical protein
MSEEKKKQTVESTVTKTPEQMFIETNDLLTRVVKALRAILTRVEALEARNTELEGRINVLSGRMDAIGPGQDGGEKRIRAPKKPQR